MSFQRGETWLRLTRTVLSTNGRTQWIPSLRNPQYFPNRMITNHSSGFTIRTPINKQIRAPKKRSLTTF